jgi:hypothetical protein
VRCGGCGINVRIPQSRSQSRPAGGGDPPRPPDPQQAPAPPKK